MGFSVFTDHGRLEGEVLNAELEMRVEALREHGVGPGSLAALAAPVGAETVLELLALRRVGAKVALLHPRWSQAELGAAVDRIGPDVVVASSLWVRGDTRSAARLRGADYVVFTSGSEGAPKAVLLSQEGFEAHARAAAARLPQTEDDRWLLTLTPAHVGGLALLLRARTLGAALVVTDTPLPDDLDPIVRRHSITHVSLVPTQFARWLETRSRGPVPPSLACVLLGGASCPPELERRARRDGWPLRLTYGMTETSSQVCTQTADSPPGSAGPPLDGAEVRIESPDASGVGTIVVRSPWTAKGTLDAPFLTQRDGWLVTQDLGRLDEEGILWVTGRRDDVIVSGGEKVEPSEVEAVLRTQPDVADACVVGRADPEWGQRVVAVVVAREGTTLDATALVEACRARLAAFKVPKDVLVWPELPRSANGKVSRAQARARLAGATVPT